MKLLNIQDLSVEQKIGQLIMARTPAMLDADDAEFALELIRNHALGGVQVAPKAGAREIIDRILQAADYPIFIAADMENGFQLGDLQISSNLALGIIDDPQTAYDFAKITAIQAKNFGYNMIWSPIVDRPTRKSISATLRAFGSTRERVAELSIAYMKAFADCGVVGAAKHYPSARDCAGDSHMHEKISHHTREELLEENLYPYRKMVEALGADMMGVMTTHAQLINLDPVYPTSLSKPSIDLLKEIGFDGLVVSDSLAMMAVAQKFGDDVTPGLAVAAGNDLVLPNYRRTLRYSYNALLESYRKGVFTEERLNEACARVLRAQERTLRQPARKEITEQDRRTVAHINRDCVCAVTDPGLIPAIDPEKRHLFVVLKRNIYEPGDLSANYEIENDKGWNPKLMGKLLLEKFPNSDVQYICEFPHRDQNERICAAAVRHDDVVFVTFCEANAYQGANGLTERMRYLIDSLSSRIVAIVHIGNPFAMEPVAHVPRLIFGLPHKACYETIPGILAGELPVQGTLPMQLQLK